MLTMVSKSATVSVIPRELLILVLSPKLRLLSCPTKRNLLKIEREWISSSLERARSGKISLWNNVSLLLLAFTAGSFLSRC